MRRSSLSTCGGAVLAFAALSMIAIADSTTHVSVPVSEGVRIRSSIAIDCSNHPGPTVTLSGGLALDAIGIKAIFRNNVKGTHEYTTVLTVTSSLLPPGQTITIPKQPPLGGVGGNPFIWLQFLNGAGEPLTSKLFLGRCVQGLNTFGVDKSFPLDALITGNAAITCTNHPGPFITFTGGLTLGGLKARFFFSNNDNPVNGPHNAVTTVDFTLIANGTTITFPKQPSLGGVGGNPLIYIQFLDENGSPLSGEIALGRCVQGSKN